MSKAKKKGQNKTQYILSLPASLTASEVVARAKAAGLTISRNLVYVARHGAGKKRGPGRPPKTRGPGRPPKTRGPGRPRKARGPGRPPKAAVRKAATPSAVNLGRLTADEHELASLVLAIGLDRVASLLAQVRRALR